MLFMRTQLSASPLQSGRHSLEAQKGQFILKYFLLEERRKGTAELSRKLG